MAAVETPAQDEHPVAMPRPKRWTGAEYDRAVEMGLFDHQRLELIQGEVLEMSPMNDPHAQGITLVHYALLRVFPAERFTVRVQCPMRLGADSRPEPDLAVVSGGPREQTGHPTSALLIVEISDTTLDFDRSQKALLYARHGIGEYWIVNLAERRVEVRRDPVTGEDGRATGASRS
jgi:Uma2 family endonuclease